MIAIDNVAGQQDMHGGQPHAGGYAVDEGKGRGEFIFGENAGLDRRPLDRAARDGGLVMPATRRRASRSPTEFASFMVRVPVATSRFVLLASALMNCGHYPPSTAHDVVSQTMENTRITSDRTRSLNGAKLLSHSDKFTSVLSKKAQPMDRNVTNSVIVTRSKTGSITNNVNIGRHVADEDWAELFSLAKPHGKNVIKQLLEVQNLVNANKGEQARSTWEKIRVSSRSRMQPTSRRS